MSAGGLLPTVEAPGGGCSTVTANTVYADQLMGLYVQKGADPGTYLAAVPGGRDSGARFDRGSRRAGRLRVGEAGV
jgi:hypothetical protein